MHSLALNVMFFLFLQYLDTYGIVLICAMKSGVFAVYLDLFYIDAIGN